MPDLDQIRQRYDCPHQDAFEWEAPQDVWKFVMDGRDGFVCLDCFRLLAAAKNLPIWVKVDLWSGCDCAFTDEQRYNLARMLENR